MLQASWLRPIGVTGLFFLTAALLAGHVSYQPVYADHSDGNMPLSVNYWVVESQLRVCDHSSLITTTQLNNGLAYWNSGLGKTILVNSCTNYGVDLVDVPNGGCGYRDDGVTPVGACAQYPDADSTQIRTLKVAPYLPNESVSPADTSFPFVIAHELGHNLGFNHTDNSNCAYSIMNDPRCDPPFGTLPQADKDNYHNGYHVDAPEAGASTNPQNYHQVTISIDGADIHNESGYLIVRLNPCSGQWDLVDTAPKNASSKLLTAQQGGQQTYQVMGLTNADPSHATGKADTVLVANIPSPLGVPSSTASTFISPTVNRITWGPPAGTGPAPAFYKVQTDVVPTGTYAPSCVQTSSLQHDTAMPFPSNAQNIPYYRRVKACDSSGLCGALAPYSVIEHFNQDGYNYAFTYHRFSGAGQSPVGGSARLASDIPSLVEARRFVAELVRSLIPGLGTDDERSSKTAGGAKFSPVYQSGVYIVFQYVNYMTRPLLLHIKNGYVVGSPNVQDTGCTNYPSPGAQTVSAPVAIHDPDVTLSTNRLGTRGHGTTTEDQCDTSVPVQSHDDSDVVGWGWVPPYGP
jgi:hypothetical protein